MGSTPRHRSRVRQRWAPAMTVAFREAERDGPGYRGTLFQHRLGRSMLADALLRGSECGRDFSNVDLLAMATRDIEDVRVDFCVPPRQVP